MLRTASNITALIEGEKSRWSYNQQVQMHGRRQLGREELKVKGKGKLKTVYDLHRPVWF